MRRRSLLSAAACTPLLLTSCRTNTLVPSAAMCPQAAALLQLEQQSGGRLGVFIIDSASRRHSGGYRADERFGMCSTFKLPLAAIILREIERGPLEAEQWVPYGEKDMLSYAPVTRKHLAKGGMTVLALAEAAQKTSDNVAANLLLKLVGGPEGFTAKLRAMGDSKTRLDRYEPDMNLVPNGEIRDTTTPRSMAGILAQIFTSDHLTMSGRETLKQWTIDTKTGLKRLRAGLPKDWVVGDKTGTAIHSSMANKHNDIAICRRPGRAEPIIITAYYEAPSHYGRMRTQDDAILAKVGRIVAETI